MPEPSSTAKPRRTRLSAADRKASIVAAAVEVFSEAGYQRAKMSEVARRVGVSEPVVFQNFGTKAALYAAVLGEAAERMSAGIRAGAQAPGSAGAWLAEFLSPGHLDQVHARGSLGALFADAMALTAQPEVEEAARNATRTMADALAELLARGRDEGSLSEDLDPVAGAWWLLSLLASQGLRMATVPDYHRLEAGLGEMTLRALTQSRRGRVGPPPRRPAAE